MADVVFVQPCLVIKALSAFHAGIGTGRKQLLRLLVEGLVPAQVRKLAEALAAVRALMRQAVASRMAQAVTLVVGQLAKAAAAVRAIKGGPQAVRAVGGRGGRMAPLVADERPRALEGLVANEADEEGVAQVGLHKVLWVFPLHVPRLELLVWECDQAVKTLVCAQAVWRGGRKTESVKQGLTEPAV